MANISTACLASPDSVSGAPSARSSEVRSRRRANVGTGLIEALRARSVLPGSPVAVSSSASQSTIAAQKPSAHSAVGRGCRSVVVLSAAARGDKHEPEDERQ